MGLELDRRGSESRFAAYVETLTTALGHADRAAPFRSYCTGLLLPGPRKSVEPIAARVAPAQVRATHQSLHHLVASADWSDEAVLSVVRQQVLPAMERHGARTDVARLGFLTASGFRPNHRSLWGRSKRRCRPTCRQLPC